MLSYDPELTATQKHVVKLLKDLIGNYNVYND